jgi:colanic acid/amylovoran biosynthesis glycosyltransferase
MPRIALIAPTFPKLSETFIAAKLQALLDRGWDVHVVCGRSTRSEWSHFPSLQRRLGIRRRVHVGRPHRPRWLAALLLLPTLIWLLLVSPRGMWRYLSRGWRRFGLNTIRHCYLDADLIALRPELLHFEFGALAVGRTYLKELLGCPLVVSFRGYDLNYVGLENAGYYQDLWDSADALHLLGNDLWLRARGRGCPAEKLHALIPPAIDTSFFDPGQRQHSKVVGTPGRPLRILSIGRLEWKKGYEYALQAVKMLVERGISCEYHIVGDGEYLEAVAFARHQLGLEQVVSFMGAQSPSAVKSELIWADLFLHAAVSEGFCNAVLEAQAMALPVVCSDADGLPENVAEGLSGFVVPRRDSAALAEKLARVAGDVMLRRKMAFAGRERVLRQFQQADQIAAFEQLYQLVLAPAQQARTEFPMPTGSSLVGSNEQSSNE